MRLIYLFLFLFTFVIICFCFRKETRKILISTVIAIFVTAVSYGINTILVLPFDTLTITALGEKNEKAEGISVVLSEVDVDGKQANYHVSSGNWLSTGNQLKWGSVAPTNLSKEVSIRIPRGSNRNIKFFANKWTGKASLDINDSEIQVIDTYSSEDSFQSVSIASSTGFLNIGFDGIGIIILEGIIFSLISIIFIKNLNKIFNLIKKYPDESIYMLIAIIGFIVMILCADERSTWADDTSTMGIGNKYRTLVDVIKTNIKEEPTAPPLMAIVWHYWSKLIPVGTEHLVLWAKFVGILANTIGFFSIAKVVKRGWNKYIALFTEVLLVSSQFLITTSAYAVRPYAILILVTIYFISVMVSREQKTQIGVKDTLVLTLAILLICYTHFFGILFTFGYFCYEAIKFMQKKISYRFIFSYILAGILYLPWLILAYIGAEKVFGGKFWPEVPKFSSIYALLLTLCDMQGLILGFLLLGLFLTIVMVYQNYKQKNLASKCVIQGCNEVGLQVNVAFIFELVITVGVAFIYSGYLKPSASVWVSRYFSELIPIIAIIASFAIYVFAEKVSSKNTFMLVAIAFLYMVSSNIPGRLAVEESTIYQPYREAADFLLNQLDVSYSDTLVIASAYYSNGWDYYLTHNGKYNDIHYVQTINGIDLSKFNVVYLFDVHVPLSNGEKELLNNSFNLSYQDSKSGVYKYVRK